MKRDYTPHPYQLIGARHLIENPRAALWASMGMGKTVTVATMLDALYSFGFESQPTLIVAPKRVALNVWPSEFQKWAHLSIECVPIIGDVSERVAAMKRDVPVYSINYDNLVWLKKALKGEWPYKTIIADESTRLKGFRLKQGTARAKVLAQVAHTKVERFVELTGTPAPNGLLDLWGQMYMLDAGARLGRSFTSYCDRWFSSQISPDGYPIRRPMPHAQAEIQHLVKDICLTLDAKDWFDLDEPIVRKIEVDLPPVARQAYRAMERDMFAQIEQHGVDAANAGAVSSKCAQMANGAVYVNDAKEWAVTHEEKLDALESIIEEANGAPVLVSYEFQHDLSRLRQRFPHGVLLDDKKATENAWNKGKIPVLFAHPQSAGHGLNLQDGGNILAFFGHSWNLEYYQQMVERIGPMRQKQSGHERPVFIYHIVARNTVDELMQDRRESKRSVQDILLAAAKRGV